MSPLAQPVSTYSDTTPQKREITDVISLIDPTDAPLVNALGGLDGASGKFRFVNSPQTTYEWLEDTALPLTSSLTTASYTSAATTISVTSALYFEPGHVVAVGTEHMWVSSCDSTNNILTVSRGQFGTTAATHASTDTIEIIGMARLEGAESSTILLTDRTVGSNWTQIFHQEVKVTRTQSQISQYGISDEMAYQGDKAVPNLMRQIEKAVLFQKTGQLGSATTPRAFSGFRGLATTYWFAGAALAASDIEYALMSCYLAGATGPWLVPSHPINLQRIKNLYETTSYMMVPRTETTMGMEITRIHTPWGDADLLLDRWVSSTELPIIEPKHAGLRTFFPFTQKALAITGDYERSEVVGEFGFCLRQDKAHAFLTAITA